MTETEWGEHWQRLYDEVFIVGPPAERGRMKPTEQHLERLEEKLQIRLPLSYRAFIKVFGPGYLARSFPIYAPGYRQAPVVDVLANNKWQQHEERYRPNPEMVQRCVAFSEFGYQLIVWDTGEVTDPDGPEYRILRLPREDDEGFIPVTDRFQTFIEEFCLAGGYIRMLGGTPEDTWEDDETGEIRSIRCFHPIRGAPGSNV